MTTSSENIDKVHRLLVLLQFDRMQSRVAKISLDGLDSASTTELEQSLIVFRRWEASNSEIVKKMNVKFLALISDQNADNPELEISELRRLSKLCAHEPDLVAILADRVIEEIHKIGKVVVSNPWWRTRFVTYLDVVANRFYNLCLSKKMRGQIRNDAARIFAEALLSINQYGIENPAQQLSRVMSNVARAAIAYETFFKISTVSSSSNHRLNAAVVSTGLALYELWKDQPNSWINLFAEKDIKRRFDKMINAADNLRIAANLRVDSLYDNSGKDLRTCSIQAYVQALGIEGIAETDEFMARRKLAITQRDAAIDLLKQEGSSRKDAASRLFIESAKQYDTLKESGIVERLGSQGKIIFSLSEIELIAIALEFFPETEKLIEHVNHLIFNLISEHDGQFQSRLPGDIFVRIYRDYLGDTNLGVNRLDEFIEVATAEGKMGAVKSASSIKRVLQGRLARNTSKIRDLQFYANRTDLTWYEFAQAMEQLTSISILDEAGVEFAAAYTEPRKNFWSTLLFEILAFEKRMAQDKYVIDSVDAGAELQEFQLHVLMKYEVERDLLYAVEFLSKYFLEKANGPGSEFYLSNCRNVLNIGLERTDDKFFYARLAEAYRKEGNLEQGAEAAKLGISKFPFDTHLKLQLALVEAANGDYSSSKAVMEEAYTLAKLKTKSIDPSVPGLLAYCAMRSGFWQLAFDTYSEILTSNPNDWRAHFGLAELYFSDGPDNYGLSISKWCDCILSLIKEKGEWTEKIEKRCLSHISQAFHELLNTGHGEEGLIEFRRLTSALPAHRVAEVLKGLAVRGGLRSRLHDLEVEIRKYGSRTVNCAFSQLCADSIISDLLNGQSTEYLRSCLQFCLKKQTLGDFWGGAKSVYAREVFRLSANPLKFAQVKLRIESATSINIPKQFQAIARRVRIPGKTDQYYGDLYDLIPLDVDGNSTEELEDVTRYIFLSTSSIFVNKAEDRLIYVDLEPKMDFHRFFALQRTDAKASLFECDLDYVKNCELVLGAKPSHCLAEKAFWTIDRRPNVTELKGLAAGGVYFNEDFMYVSHLGQLDASGFQ